MKRRFLAILLAAALLCCAIPAAGTMEDTVKYTTLNVGTTTAFNGNFFSSAWGDNIADMDVRMLIHGLSPVCWDNDNGTYVFDEHVVGGKLVTEDADGNLTYILYFDDDLYYSDGTPVTAKDYAFAILLSAAKEMAEAGGGRMDGSSILGFADYDSGAVPYLKGLRLPGGNCLSVTIDAAYRPYFYELAILDVNPVPIDVIAPGCSVTDDGEGAAISGPFTADLLRQTMLAEGTGYMSYPTVTSGPYMLESYSGDKVVLKANPYYKGNKNGNRPTVPQIVFRTVTNESIIGELENETLDLAVRCTRQDTIAAGIELTGRNICGMVNYARNGLSYFAFCCERPAVSDAAVRRAVMLCTDRDRITEAYTGAYGLKADGWYGMGQWMFSRLDGQVEGITTYACDVEEAKKVLEDAGWIAGEDGIRCREIDGETVRLELKLIYPEGNTIADLLDESMTSALKEAGIALTAEAAGMDELLLRYYRIKDRDCDMIYLATNFGVVFDPALTYDPAAGELNNLSSLTDEELYELALDMRKTEPGDLDAYMTKWQAFQAKWTELLPAVPVYSNVYFDFFNTALHEYTMYGNAGWAQAIVDAYLGDRMDQEILEEQTY
ncbi:MAG: ABC transporter substrate-binding protein [Clostridia bacterium]|nr:ABC transporter substrate-binding protein [Clostridia bacterium]